MNKDEYAAVRLRLSNGGVAYFRGTFTEYMKASVYGAYIDVEGAEMVNPAHVVAIKVVTKNTSGTSW